MAFVDKTLVCSDCGAEFSFTAGEQEFHQSKGFTNEPRRCPSCRRARKGMDGSAAPSRPPRELFSVTCASCGKEAKVPFEPRGDRPVYCSDCFQPQPRSVGGGYSGGRTGGGGSAAGYSGDRGDRGGPSTLGGGYGGGFGGYPEVGRGDRGDRGDRGGRGERGDRRSRRW